MGPRRPTVTFLFYLSTCSLAAAQLPANLHRLHDWSTRHVLFSGLTPETVSAAIQSDPRALHSWLDHARHHFESPMQPQPELDERREPADSDRSDDHRRRHHHRNHKKNSLATDWQMPLSLGVGPRSAPAKFGFNLNAVPDCTNDYAVFPTSNSNTPGSIGPNVNATVIAYNNLYTGPGPSGICPHSRRAGAAILRSFRLQHLHREHRKS